MSNSTTKQVLFKILFLESLTVTLAIAGAIAFGKTPDIHFQDEGFVSVVSCVQLLIAAFLSWKIFQLARCSQQIKLYQNRHFWLIISLGLIFLALDDAIGIHEQIDFWLHDLFRIQETDITDLADDLIVGGYLILFLIYIAFKWQTIQLFKRSFGLFQLGFVLTLVMVVLDMASNGDYFTLLIIDDVAQALALKLWLRALEDSVKIFAEGMFIVAIYQCWQIAKLMTNDH
ncbi:MAG: hypothetical protein QNJ53_08275 [Pleurocapsa sp. MO_192.B19]|nr:hypothetical protein [Pleurocapsa sp. MO_192.B19]